MTENPTPPDDDDNDELELEPIDPEILARQKERGKRTAREAEASVDIEELYRESEETEPLDLGELENFRFTTRHLLIVTALLAVVMTLCKLTSLCTGLFLSIGVAVAGGYYFVHQRERRHAKEMDRRRREVEDRLAARRAGQEGEPVEQTMQPISADVNATWAAANRESASFKFSFSLKEFFGAFTAAAIVLALLSVMAPGQLALLLGLTALLGLVIHAVGYDPPRVVILCWWLMLVLYLVLGLWAAFGPDDQASVTPQQSPWVAIHGCNRTKVQNPS